MEDFGVKQRSNINLAERVLLFKNTLRQWFYFAGLRYLQSHELSDSQERFLESITDFFIKYMDNIETDEDFMLKRKLDPINIPVTGKIIPRKRNARL